MGRPNKRQRRLMRKQAMAGHKPAHTMHAPVQHVSQEERDLILMARKHDIAMPNALINWLSFFQTRKDFIAEFTRWLTLKIKNPTLNIPVLVPYKGTLKNVTKHVKEQGELPLIDKTGSWKDDEEEYYSYFQNKYQPRKVTDDGNHYADWWKQHYIEKDPAIEAPSGISVDVEHAHFLI